MKGNSPMGWKMLSPEPRSTLDCDSLAGMVSNIILIEVVKKVKMLSI